MEYVNPNAAPCCVNLALVKLRAESTAVPNGLDDPVFTNATFRDGTQDSRALSFVSGGNKNDSLVNNRYPLNPDKFVILSHQRVWLSGNAGSVQATNNKNNWKTYKKYIPLKRQLRFFGTGDEQGYEKVYLLIWGDVLGLNTAADPQTITLVDIRFFIHGVFREPKP